LLITPDDSLLFRLTLLVCL